MIQRLRQRDPAAIGAVGLTLLVVVSLGAFYFEDLPVVGGGTTYSADFAEAAGLKPDDEVRVAGVKTGKVTAMALEGKHVRVDFRVDGAWLGDRTTASIEIKTLLGQKYLALDPQGSRELDDDKPIPVERTRSPYDVTEAFEDLGSATGEIDTGELGRSFEVMADTFRGSPQHVGEALRGLSALSKTISSRDEQLKQLLHNTGRVSQTLGDRDKEFAKLISDGNLLLEEIRFRKDAISTMLASTQQLSLQLRGVVADNGKQLHTALATLDRVTSILHQNQENLSRGLQNLAPFARMFTNTVGNGRWFDSYVCGQVPPVLHAGPVGVNEEGCRPPVAGQGQGGPR
jgi:phospholipid/cholesterol/gamma-HCH transport system substrate-binding protein